MEEAKAQFQKSWDAWKARATPTELPDDLADKEYAARFIRSGVRRKSLASLNDGSLLRHAAQPWRGPWRVTASGATQWSATSRSAGLCS